jgi:primary-amine oxidase
MTSRPHPLDPLSVIETNAARQIILDVRGTEAIIYFRSIALEEPLKAELIKFLDLEHAGQIAIDTKWPARVAKVQYDVVKGDGSHEYMESLIDIETEKETKLRIVEKMYQAALTM